MLLKAPPTRVWPLGSGVSALTTPSGLAVNPPLTVLSAFRRARYGAASPPTWVNAPPTKTAPPVSTAVKLPPTKIDPSRSTAIEFTVELSPGSNVGSTVPSAFRRAMKSRVVEMAELFGSKDVKSPPTRIWPFDCRAMVTTDEFGYG